MFKSPWSTCSCIAYRYLFSLDDYINGEETQATRTWIHAPRHFLNSWPPSKQNRCYDMNRTATEQGVNNEAWKCLFRDPCPKLPSQFLSAVLIKSGWEEEGFIFSPQFKAEVHSGGRKVEVTIYSNTMGAVEVAQGLTVRTALSEDQSLVPSTGVRQLIVCKSSFKGPDALFWPLWASSLALAHASTNTHIT